MPRRTMIRSEVRQQNEVPMFEPPPLHGHGEAALNLVVGEEQDGDGGDQGLGAEEEEEDNDQQNMFEHPDDIDTTMNNISDFVRHQSDTPGQNRSSRSATMTDRPPQTATTTSRPYSEEAHQQFNTSMHRLLVGHLVNSEFPEFTTVDSNALDVLVQSAKQHIRQVIKAVKDLPTSKKSSLTFSDVVSVIEPGIYIEPKKIVEV